MKLLYSFLFLFCASAIAQKNYPSDYFRLPLDIPMRLAGNYGELRPNHFHGGFDFRTLQQEGHTVHAVAEGYISRIKISTFGNGKTIYISHPNGYTSVYAHLQRASGKIEEYIKKNHYKDQAYEIEMFPRPDEFIVNKGDTIALSGNTGSSEGPHLHFEFRDTKTEKVINPYFFGFDRLMKDTKKPVLSAVMVYPVDENSNVQQSKRPIAVSLSLQADGNYIGEAIKAKGKIGFGIIAHDMIDYSYDKFALFNVKAFVNGSPSFNFQFDEISFDETRYINAYIDYPRYKKTKQRVQKLFMNKPFALSNIYTNSDFGVITVLPNMNYTYRIEVADFYGNTTTVSIPIEYSISAPNISEDTIKTNYLINSDTDAIFEKDNFSVFFPAKTFYDDFYLDFDVKDKVMTLHNETVPVSTTFLVTVIDSTTVDDGKTFIASVREKSLGYNFTKRKGNTFTTYTKNLGKFTLARDTIAPKISIAKPIEGKWITDQKTIRLTISDGMSGIKSYNGYLNGKWVLFEYENKTKKITHHFSDGLVVDGKNDLKVVVTDNVGNSTIFETQFFRSQKK